MSVTVRLNESDADLLRRVIGAVGRDEGTGVQEIMVCADVRPAARPEAQIALTRLAGYLETVLKAG